MGYTPQTAFRTILPDTSRGLKYGTWQLLGDINGDSIADWALVNVLRSNVNRSLYEVYFGGIFDSLADGSVAYQDQRIYPMGDFNGDGFDDLWSVPHFLDSQMCSDRWGCGV